MTATLGKVGLELRDFETPSNSLVSKLFHVFKRSRF